MKNNDSWLEELYDDFRDKALEPPFKNNDGEYVNEFGIPINMDLWNNWKTFQPWRIKNLFSRMKKKTR